MKKGLTLMLQDAELIELCRVLIAKDAKGALEFSIVRLMARHDNVLEIEGVDALDGTPLLDIKPYVPDFDVRQDTRVGWYETRSKE